MFLHSSESLHKTPVYLANIHIENLALQTIVMPGTPPRNCLGRSSRQKAKEFDVTRGSNRKVIVDVDCRAETPTWVQNVQRGYSIGNSSHKLDKDGIVKIRLVLLDAGFLISQIRIY